MQLFLCHYILRCNVYNYYITFTLFNNKKTIVWFCCRQLSSFQFVCIKIWYHINSNSLINEKYNILIRIRENINAYAYGCFKWLLHRCFEVKKETTWKQPLKKHKNVKTYNINNTSYVLGKFGNLLTLASGMSRS